MSRSPAALSGRPPVPPARLVVRRRTPALRNSHRRAGTIGCAGGTLARAVRCRSRLAAGPQESNERCPRTGIPTSPSPRSAVRPPMLDRRDRCPTRHGRSTPTICRSPPSRAMSSGPCSVSAASSVATGSPSPRRPASPPSQAATCRRARRPRRPSRLAASTSGSSPAAAAFPTTDEPRAANGGGRTAVGRLTPTTGACRCGDIPRPVAAGRCTLVARRGSSSAVRAAVLYTARRWFESTLPHHFAGGLPTEEPQRLAIWSRSAGRTTAPDGSEASP